MQMFQEELAQAAQRVTVGSNENKYDNGQGNLHQGNGLAGMPSFNPKPAGLE